MRIRNQRDFASGLIFLLVGVAFAVGALGYPMGHSARPGAAYFPLILSVLLAILAVGVIVKSLASGEAGAHPIGRIAWRPLLIVIASIVVFGVLLPWLGMLVTIPVLIVMVSCAGGPLQWKGALIASLVLTAGSWAVFVYGLNLAIPLVPAFLG